VSIFIKFNDKLAGALMTKKTSYFVFGIIFLSLVIVFWVQEREAQSIPVRAVQLSHYGVTKPIQSPSAAMPENTSSAREDKAHPPARTASNDNTTLDAESRTVLVIRRTGLDNVDRLKEFSINRNSTVRSAVIKRYRDLEYEYELENNITRSINDSGTFIHEIIKNLLDETDDFVRGEALAYFREYAGDGDGNVKAALQQLLLRSDLSPNTLNHVAELFIDNYKLSIKQVTQIINNSPSTNILSEFEKTNLHASLSELINTSSSDNADANNTEQQK
jgi:hypothetical protein